MAEEKKGIKVPDFNSETSNKKPSAGHNVSLHTGRLQVDRPQHFNKLEEKGFDMNALKTIIESKLKKGKIQEPSSEVKFTGSGRVLTGIPGLDGVMGGGFEKGSVNMIGGGPGSGKSIFAMQFIVNGIEKFNESGLYVTFEENKEELYKHMQPFGWNLEKYEKQGKLTILEYTPEQVKKLLDEGGGIMETVVEKIKAKRLVIDSLTAFSLLFDTVLLRREAALDLFKMVSRWGCTTLLVIEQESEIERHRSNTIEFEVDGIVLLYYIRKGDIRERALEILKLRGSPHSAKLFPMKINNNGIVIYPEETVF
ncbi:hypothetical protein HYX19_03385 [Candidatus Woesearchaeota archaeon]|nr:hypothetical protein [Candidatus Woesearchaeota archaeon]